MTPLPGSAIGGPSNTLSANEIRPKTAVPMALITGGTSICGAVALAVTCGSASIGVASVRFDRFGANVASASTTFVWATSPCRRSSCATFVDSVSTVPTVSTGSGVVTGSV